MLNLTATIIATIIAASTLNSLPKLSQEHTSDITSMTQEQRIEKQKRFMRKVLIMNMGSPKRLIVL